MSELACINSISTPLIEQSRLRNAVVYNNFAYVIDVSYARILQIDLSTNNVTNWINTTIGGIALLTDGINLYFSRNTDNGIYKIPLSPNPTGIIDSYLWCTDSQIISPTGLTLYEDHLYVSNRANGTISKINLTTALPPSGTPWLTGLYSPGRMVIYNNYLYVINAKGTTGLNLSMNNTISKISFLNPSIEIFISSTNLNNPFALTIYNDYLYITENLQTNGFFTTKSINLIGTPIISTVISSNTIQQFGIFSYNNYIYTTGVNNTFLKGTINQFKVVSSLIPPPIDISYNRSTKVLTWSSREGYNSFIIEESSKLIPIGITNDTSFNLTDFISQNISFTLLKIKVRQNTSTDVGIASNITIDLAQPAPTGILYNTSTKVLTWNGTLPYDSFIIEEPSRSLLIGTSNVTSFNLTTFISQNPSFYIIKYCSKTINF